VVGTLPICVDQGSVIELQVAANPGVANQAHGWITTAYPVPLINKCKFYML